MRVLGDCVTLVLKLNLLIGWVFKDYLIILILMFCSLGVIREMLLLSLLAAVYSFFSSSKLLGELNATTITLVPKVPNPSTMSEFRLISCCNIIYKCITKLLANHLKACLDILMSLTQIVFIPGRSISENVLLAQELVMKFLFYFNK